MKKKKRKKSTSGPLGLDKVLLKYLKGFPGKKFTKKAIFRKFIRRNNKDKIAKALDKLIDKGKVLIEDNHIVYQPKTSTEGKRQYEGVLEMTQYGYAFVICDELDQDIFISSRRLHRALDRDRVKAVITRKRSNGKLDGEIVEIVERGHSQFLGTVHISENFAFLIADRRNMLHDIFIPLDNLNGAKHGEKAMAEITKWPFESKSPVGKIVEVLGESGLNDVEMKAILLENGFPLSFSPKAIKEAEDIPDSISEQEIAKRRDLRDITTFTIDPDDAKDFDDALSVKKFAEDRWEIGVHIADVTHYVKPDSPLDKDAYERATSVYLVDRVLPMLPEKLSNKVCSLRPNEEKLCFSVVFVMNLKAEIENVWYGKTIINSDKRFTYKEAQESIDSGTGKFVQELQLLNDLAKQLREERTKQGSISFETVEVKIRVDKEGKPTEVAVKEMLGTNRLIEDFMLLANKYVAKRAVKLQVKGQPVPFVYRVHDNPDMLKLEVFSKFAKNFGYQIKFTEPGEVADQLNRLFEMIRGKKEQNVLESLAIRSMAKASYTTNNIGHFGLAFEHYSHFTSPIRRYPDVLAHRILFDILENKEIMYQKENLQQMCNHASQRERDAMTAERESVKYKQVEFMQGRLGEEFDGIISGVIHKGLFVELVENKCEGFISVRDLGDDDFIFDESNYCLVNPVDNRTFRLGDEIRVRLVATNLENRTIDFVLAE